MTFSQTDIDLLKEDIPRPRKTDTVYIKDPEMRYIRDVLFTIYIVNRTSLVTWKIIQFLNVIYYLTVKVVACTLKITILVPLENTFNAVLWSLFIHNVKKNTRKCKNSIKVTSGDFNVMA